MSVKARWRLAELIEEDDPFDAVILSSGLQVDLDGSEEELFAALTETLRIESAIFNRGITCHLKDGGQDCRTCPVQQLDRDAPLSALCRVGKDQLEINGRFTLLNAAKRLAVWDELALAADALSELGHMDDACAELLTAAGW